jgi:mRNA-degrading endonuclease toxin of MazEF toxin-antitoxin module
LSEEAYPTGSVVLVPFPFTDLSGRKRRPALVISPQEFDDEDLVLCAITSQFPERFSEWEASLGAEDMVEERLPKPSVVKVGKLFTMHRSLIARRFGTVKEHKLEEILSRLRTLFARPARITETDSTDREAGLKTEEVDEAVLGLLYLNTFKHHGQVRAWKSFDWDAMDRLHEHDLIGDPKSKAKSVPLTAEGITLARESFRNRFALE